MAMYGHVRTISVTSGHFDQPLVTLELIPVTLEQLLVTVELLPVILISFESFPVVRKNFDPL